MTPTPSQIRSLSRILVQSLPADLVRDLAALERRGQLGGVLDRAFGRALMHRSATETVAATLRAELAALVSTIAAPARAATTIELGAFDVARTAHAF